MPKIKIITNGRIVLKDSILDNHSVVFSDSTIIGIFPMDTVPEQYKDATVYDAGGLFISPGFIDVHVHGGGGYECIKTAPEDIVKMCNAHARFGTTSILPTTSSNSVPVIRDALEAIKKASAICNGCNILGAHVEGPYVNPVQCGAQNKDFFIKPNPDRYDEIVGAWDKIRIVGLAPEIEGNLEFARYLTNKGIVVSIAHSDATFEQVEESLNYGIKDVTHIYSGCSGVHRVNAYRVAGLIEAGLFFDSLTVQVIADGKHLPSSLLRLIYKCKGPDRISLITDAQCGAATDMKEGTIVSRPNGKQMILDDGVFKLLDKQAFVGSAATTNMLVRNMIKLAGVSLPEAVRMASLTPAKLIHFDNRKGSLEPGKDADIILFDNDINVKQVFVMGRNTYSSI